MFAHVHAHTHTHTTESLFIFSCRTYHYLTLCMCVLVAQLCPTVCDPIWTVTHQAPLSMGILQIRILSGLPFPSPGDLFNSGIDGSLALQADSLPSEPPGKHLTLYHTSIFDFLSSQLIA